jgi:putative transposase
MARIPRVQFPGAIYHVMNRGNLRDRIFGTPEAAAAFIDCLWEACRQTQWKVYAYCVMRNHYHLAIETPEGNLVEGVHWLQSAFSNRFNRFRKQSGRAFQGRYKAILVEPGIHLLHLTCYLHLNPVQENLVPIEQLADFRWSSYRAYRRMDKASRPPALKPQPWLSELGGAGDDPEGWQTYHSYLERLMNESKLRADAGFDRIGRALVVFGSKTIFAGQRRLDLQGAERGSSDRGGTELAAGRPHQVGNRSYHSGARAPWQEPRILSPT